MEQEQSVVEQYITLSINDPFREGRKIQIMVRTNDEDCRYHGKVARYMALQKSLLGHFYRHVEEMNKAKMQHILLRANQTMKDSEIPVLKGYMAQSVSALVAALHMRKLVICGTHVQAFFHLDGLTEHMETDELMVPFTNLTIARDVEAIDIEEPFEQAA
ncbi:hypothetical protein [Pseudomonas amygdali]|uniref:Uncharacterized protein n=2 Tax=Pseudomonas amygdali pv. lachrymans TaxID=53707 RepID=A0ABR5KSA6_PSEAV|nr:hypothetical protein [Pseudomonas amygdali]AXH59997.1 hypothetical protein PLA107_032750 [Pseudomonas amygdali pv. lachrymans str. M301315]KPC17401.1 Uncharacterized protein AC499_0603 [Pseudomonas amygdali pv. lachrymans]RMT06434.1 hypothetical protein ALP54_102587 [Pseudomonas amygdali pv. lachrymans]